MFASLSFQICIVLFSKCGSVSFQIDADDDIVDMLGKQIVVDYQQQKVFKL